MGVEEKAWVVVEVEGVRLAAGGGAIDGSEDGESAEEQDPGVAVGEEEEAEEGAMADEGEKEEADEQREVGEPGEIEVGEEVESKVEDE